MSSESVNTNGYISRLLKERDELNDQVSSLQIEMGLKASPLEGNLYDTLHSLK